MQLLSVHSGAEPNLPIIVPTGWSSSRGLLASPPTSGNPITLSDSIYTITSIQVWELTFSCTVTITTHHYRSIVTT